jgi:hypothetical protein
LKFENERVAPLSLSLNERFDVLSKWHIVGVKRCSCITFTHICEWRKHSPSSGSLGSLGWSLVVAIVALGSTPMIYLPLSGSDSDSKTTSDSEDFTSATNDFFER